MFNWEKSLFGSKEESKRAHDYLATLPGPSPWALRASSQEFGVYRWEEAGEKSPAVGKILLLNKERQVILVVDFDNYILKLSDSKLLIWWQQKTERMQPSNPIQFTLLDLEKLGPIQTDLIEIYKGQRLRAEGIYFEGSPTIRFDIKTTLAGEEIKFDAPVELKNIEELFVLCCSTGIRDCDYFQMMNIGLMVINFKKGGYRIYPQEWFNKGSFDFMYQWISKIGRDPVTHEIIGEGVRIGSFVLKKDYSGIKGSI